MQQMQQDVDGILIPGIVSSLSRGGIPLDEVLRAVSALYLLQGAFTATSASPEGSRGLYLHQRGWQGQGRAETPGALQACSLLPSQRCRSFPGLELCPLGLSEAPAASAAPQGTRVPCLCPEDWGKEEPAFPAFSGNPPPTSRFNQRQVSKPLPPFCLFIQINV